MFLLYNNTSVRTNITPLLLSVACNMLVYLRHGSARWRDDIVGQQGAVWTRRDDIVGQQGGGVWTWRDDSVGQQGGGYGHEEMTLWGNREGGMDMER